MTSIKSDIKIHKIKYCDPLKNTNISILVCKRAIRKPL